MTVTFQSDCDVHYALALVHQNMKDYYQRHSLNWRDNLFYQQWDKTDNITVLWHNKRVGLIRLYYEKDSCYLQDLQLETDYRRQGIGKQCLTHIINLAKKKQQNAVKLKVFNDSPAVQLYLKSGFIKVKQQGCLIFMQYPINADTSP